MAFCVRRFNKVHCLSSTIVYMRNWRQLSIFSWPARTKSNSLKLHSNSVQNELNSKFYSSMFSVEKNSTLNRGPYLSWRNPEGGCQIKASTQQQQAFSTLVLTGTSGCLTRMPCISSQMRCKHSKDKGGKGGKGKSVIQLSSEELNSVVNAKQLLFELDEVLEEFKVDLVKSASIRTNVGNLEELPVELEGDTFPLNELAQVHRKSSHLVIIDCSAFPQATKTIFDAIKDSGMNLNPQQEGTKIAVPLPKVTREHREGLASKAKVLCNSCKESLRQVHNTYVRKAKNKEGQVSSDLLFKATQKIKELLDERTKAADALLAAKQAELLK